MKVTNYDQFCKPLYSRICLILYYIFCVGVLIWIVGEGDVYRLLMAVAALFMPLVLSLLFRLFRLGRVYLVEVIYYVFAALAIPFASVLGGYDLFPPLDKILHTASGFLFAILGMIIYFYLKPGHQKERADAPLAAAFSAMTAMSSAVLWELYEYFLSFTGADPQLVATTGIHDTMQDMLVCTIGGFITAVVCYRYLRGGRRGILMGMFEDFYQVNIADKK